jgi:hypothetical protein
MWMFHNMSYANRGLATPGSMRLAQPALLLPVAPPPCMEP